MKNSIIRFLYRIAAEGNTKMRLEIIVDGQRLPVVWREARRTDFLARSPRQIEASLSRDLVRKELPRDRYHPPNLRNSSLLGERESAPWNATGDPYKLRREQHRERGWERSTSIYRLLLYRETNFSWNRSNLCNVSYQELYLIQRATLFVMKLSIRCNMPRLRSAITIREDQSP